MRDEHVQLFRVLADRIPTTDRAAPVVVPTLVKAWLEAGPAVFQGDDRVLLDALCRQIDVKKSVSVAYGEGWRRLDNEQPAEPVVVSGLVAVLLANGSLMDGPADGWGLKCANSAFKALDLSADAPFIPALRGWALEVLDRAFVTVKTTT